MGLSRPSKIGKVFSREGTLNSKEPQRGKGDDAFFRKVCSRALRLKSMLMLFDAR
jgi:hypothetical protein